jgi:phenylalanine-4-hydroxylase
MSQYTAKIADSKGFIHYTDTENHTWQTLIERQDEIAKRYACDEFVKGLSLLNMPRDRVPQCKDINEVLMELTGWSVTPVPALIPEEEFYNLLANKQFPAASFIRIPEHLNYLPEPDIFHEFYGHCPLLTNQAYADFVEWYGKTALNCSKQQFTILARLFWFTIEFGLFKQGDNVKVYGGGILSSYEETIYSATSDIPRRKTLDFLEAMRTPYRYDEIQKLYFYIESMEQLYEFQHIDFETLLQQTSELGDLPPSYHLC